jgi:hypothetical protein
MMLAREADTQVRAIVSISRPLSAPRLPHQPDPAVHISEGPGDMLRAKSGHRPHIAVLTASQYVPPSLR